ncbi:YedE-related selenium metabolism membrane protein [Clostridium sp. MCC353]|uniref:YedE family putative selenium transporter n=1 Tax=Clostridium sp. MCC353 TaxID=2592646 RepID=UPI001C00DE26|nr:YedE family putative selenium transporter [Clostridium sp. MCC353]MBT9776718.1 YedE-related selenium metabolism membrane protein [Clostridium sp. MCC353]
MGFTNTKKGLALSGVLLGLTAVVLAASGNPKNMAICIACFIRDTAGAMKFHQAAVVQYARPEITGIILGAFLISLLTKEYRSTAGSAPMIRFVLGMMMMIGALAFLGCPLRMLIRMSAGDLNAYVALVGFIAGIFTGTLVLRKGFSLGRSYDTRPSNGYILPVAVTVILILSVATQLLAFSEKGPGSMHAPVIISLTAGLVFGAVSQKCRTCFAGSVRDVILMKNFDLLTIIGGFFVVMTVHNLVTGGFHLSFTGQPVAHAQHLWNFLGLYVVGFAAVLAGGCPLRQLVLAGQGSGDAAVTFLGLFVGAAVCHNFGLAGAAASADPVSAGGLGMAGKAAVVLCIAGLFMIGFFVKKDE